MVRLNFKKSKDLFFYKLNHFLDKKRVQAYFTPISKELIKGQKDYRLVVYKNFNYKYSFFRETFEKFKSNKGGVFQRNNTIRHFYADFYEENLKEKNVENLLEIGIEHGSSLRAWSKIFPKANIFGADKNKNFLFEEPKIKTFYTDQLDKSELNNLAKQLDNKNFDVIIDDGLHTFDANINTFEALFPFLKSKTGTYFIEDIIFRDLKKYYLYF